MAIKKIENNPRLPKVTTSAISAGRNDGNDPSTTTDHINSANREKLYGRFTGEDL
jgi:hypothetical protein